MIFRDRPLGRLSAAALLASGAFTALGVPAHAAETGTDFAIEAVVGTKIADGARVKAAFAKITNRGTDTPASLVVKADTSKVEHYDEVAVFPAVPGCTGEGEAKPDLWTCVIAPEQIPGPGETLELPIVMIKRSPERETPYTAPITLTVEAPGDTDPSNDSATVQIELTTDSGVDLRVLVPDVKRQITWTMDPEEMAAAPLLVPGAKTEVLAEFANEGDLIADGIDVKVALPEGVTFSADLKECDYSADRRTADCRTSLNTMDPDERLLGVFPVEVAADVKSPVTLGGGSVSIAALNELPVTEENLARTRGALPTFLRSVAKTGTTPPQDLDPSDNSDDYAVVVADKGGSAGGNPGDGDGGNAGGAGDDGGLPVTGVQAGLIGGIGAAVLAAGGVMFLAARRRRVVLVTPDDEKPAV